MFLHWAFIPVFNTKNSIMLTVLTFKQEYSVDEYIDTIQSNYYPFDSYDIMRFANEEDRGIVDSAVAQRYGKDYVIYCLN